MEMFGVRGHVINLKYLNVHGFMCLFRNVVQNRTNVRGLAQDGT